RQQAENLANWAKKGALIGVTGRIQTRNYENQQGQRVYVTEVVADSFQMLESRSARDGMGGGASAGSYSAPSQSTNNTPRPQTNNNSATPNFGRDADPFGSSPMEISDDDLPF
ncbi:MAG: single-stranded DNA-binding protein, partial [Lactococcus lactis]|nr:single-stranded DNA-binding protein [Lactococcus lactis]